MLFRSITIVVRVLVSTDERPKMAFSTDASRTPPRASCTVVGNGQAISTDSGEEEEQEQEQEEGRRRKKKNSKNKNNKKKKKKKNKKKKNEEEERRRRRKEDAEEEERKTRSPACSSMVGMFALKYASPRAKSSAILFPLLSTYACVHASPSIAY